MPSSLLLRNSHAIFWPSSSRSTMYPHPWGLSVMNSTSWNSNSEEPGVARYSGGNRIRSESRRVIRAEVLEDFDPESNRQMALQSTKINQRREKSSSAMAKKPNTRDSNPSVQKFRDQRPFPFGRRPFFSSSFKCASRTAKTISFTVRSSTAAAILTRCMNSRGMPLNIHAPGSLVLMARHGSRSTQL